MDVGYWILDEERVLDPVFRVEDKMEVKMMKLKEIRIKRGMTQEELAEKAKISRATLSKIENGKVKLTDFFLADTIAAILGVPVEVLVPEFLEKRHSPLFRKEDAKL
ncbi:MAG: hypothetical protein PWQ27_1794 [Kosmotoga sp.]|nr:hypothetical protein [Kosmotoga sp.]MDK2954411.1 hypothetical protein [Kosmotoga sp.]